MFKFMFVASALASQFDMMAMDALKTFSKKQKKGRTDADRLDGKI